MPRLFTIFFFLLLSLSPLICNAASSDEDRQKECLGCHEDMYAKAMSYRNTHSVVRESCTKCHYQKPREGASKIMSSATFQKDMIFLLGDLIEKDNKYLIQVDARDADGNIAGPVTINSVSDKIVKLPGEPYALKEISDITVEKVEKKLYATAVISWDTDVPADYELEYGTSENGRKVLALKNIYSRGHRAVLTGLRHRSKYTFTITSSDMNGRTLRSEEQVFDTTAAFDLKRNEALSEDDRGPEVEKAVLMNIGKRKDLFIRVSSNKPVEFKASLTKIGKDVNRPCVDFVQTRTSTINICIECHRQDASHPVGVRSKNPDIRIPSDLPVIENGVITCVTCHFAHGGETAYFLRINFTKEICIKCHPKNYL